jgi:hypothetical protein
MAIDKNPLHALEIVALDKDDVALSATALTSLPVHDSTYKNTFKIDLATFKDPLAGTDYKDAVGFKVEFKTAPTDDVDPFVITSTGALATPIIADIDHVAGKVIVTVADTNVAASDIKLFAGSAPITMGDKFKAVTGSPGKFEISKDDLNKLLNDASITYGEFVFEIEDGDGNAQNNFHTRLKVESLQDPVSVSVDHLTSKIITLKAADMMAVERNRPW